MVRASLNFSARVTKSCINFRYAIIVCDIMFEYPDIPYHAAHNNRLNGIFMWYALHQILVRGLQKFLFIITSTKCISKTQIKYISSSRIKQKP